MSIKSIKIKNLLSFDELIIDNFEDINCIVGKNNAGKSNLLKLIRFFYNKLEGQRKLPPQLNSNYSAFGTITISYSISYRTKQYLNKQKKDYFFNDADILNNFLNINEINQDTIYELTLKIYSNDSIEWSTNNKDILNTINYLYPFFDIEARNVDLHNWDKLWHIISRLKSFNLKKLEENIFHKENEKNKEFNDFIKLINSTIDISKYTYKEQLLAYIKSGISGDKFVIGADELTTQSDGTNAHKFIELSLKLLIVLTKRGYITPIIYIDEPEIGLHPKKNEELIESVYSTYITEKRTTEDYPTIILATHSPNIVKQVIKLFDKNQQILHFSKKDKEPTIVQKMNSQYADKRFLNVFSDNEARLFFSNFILFVEGATELEIFCNKYLLQKFSKLKDMDVYPTDEVVLKYINPSYANTAIPYLVIYDVDKIFEINLNNKKIVFKNEVIKFSDLKKKYKKSYPNFKNKSEKYAVLTSIKLYFDIVENSKLKIKENIFIEGIEYKDKFYNYNSLIDFGNREIFNDTSRFFNHTTIEELLINGTTITIFKKWIYFYVLNAEVNTHKLKNAPIQIKLKKKKTVRKNLKKMIVDSSKYFSEDKKSVVLFLVLFGGKTQTLKKSKNVDNVFKEELIKIQENIQDNFPMFQFLFSKTSGWTTYFLNYAIKHIEKNRGKNEFRNEFKKYFGELYDIITIIEKKL